MTASAKKNPFIEFLKLYRHDIPRFVREVIGVEPDPWQLQVLKWRQEGERRISIRSGHGVGKTSLASWLMLHQIICWLPQKTVVTAPTSAQLFDAMMSELKTNIQKLPKPLQGLFDIKGDRITLIGAPDESFISARTSRAEQPEALQGIHAEHVLLIVDEASGVPEQVFEAAAGSMSGSSACTLLLGNPVRGSGFFYNTHNGQSGNWKTLRVSCVDSPRVSKEYVEEMAHRYGEDSNAFRVRVLGEFPKSDDDTVISLELVESAINRDVETNPLAPTVWGLDVARFGSDKSALAKRKANRLTEPVRTYKGLDLMELVGIVKAEYDSLPPSERPVEILVDSIGLGAGVVDRLRELSLPVRGINVSESPSMGTTYLNLRSELWFKAKTWLSARDCFLPMDETLRADLTIPRFKFTSNGKMQIESKDDIKRRGLPSPDAGDAFVLTFASDAATALHGGTRSWGKPIRRNLRLV
jgi:phage terminase large subunit